MPCLGIKFRTKKTCHEDGRTTTVTILSILAKTKVRDQNSEIKFWGLCSI